MTDTHTTAHIPDEAVQAGAEAIELACAVSTEEMARAAITAALPHLSAPCAVVVQKLEWKEHADLWHCAENTEYQITRWWSDEIRKQAGHFEVLELGEKQFGTIEEAKAAAQADFERRILSCIVTKHVDQEAKDFEAIGRSYMNVFETVTSEASGWLGYTPAECPSELLLDIFTAYREQKPVDVAAVRRQAFEEALHAISDLPTGKTEDIMEGQEQAYRVVEGLLKSETLSNDTFSGAEDSDTKLQAAAREAGWALMELVDTIDWKKRSHVSKIITELGMALEASENRTLSAEPAQGDHIADVGKMVEALKETRIDLVVLSGNIADAEKSSDKWEGMYDRVRSWIDRIDAALPAAPNMEAGK